MTPRREHGTSLTHYDGVLGLVLQALPDFLSSHFAAVLVGVVHGVVHARVEHGRQEKRRVAVAAEPGAP